MPMLADKENIQYTDKYIKINMAICQFFPLINKAFVYQMFSFGYVTIKIKQLVIQAWLAGLQFWLVNYCSNQG